MALGAVVWQCAAPSYPFPSQQISSLIQVYTIALGSVCFHALSIQSAVWLWDAFIGAFGQ